MLMFLKAIWAGLVPVGVFFIALDLRCKFDRSFRYFGIAQLLLCAMTGIDLWVLPGLRPLALELFWTRIMFIVGCQFALFYFWYMAELTEWVNRTFVRALSLYAVLLSATFFTNALLRIRDDAIVRGAGFDFLFQPFMAACLFGAVSLILRKFRRAGKPERRVLLYHLVGFVMLFVFGCLDVVFTYYVPRPFFVSFNTFGSLAFGFSVSLIFLERLLLLLKEKDAMNLRLRSAFKEISDTRAMKIVGESAALMNHEIKNFASIIKGNLTLVGQDPASLQGRENLERIRRATESLEGLSRGVLNMPGMLAVEHREICLKRTLENLLANMPIPASIQVKLDWDKQEALLQGDEEKLTRAFHNLLKNACEAGARSLRIRCLQTQLAYVLSIEDDGVGCANSQLEVVGKAFFTTKRAQGGTGLGLCVARAILENHGGFLSLYSKNELGRNETGVIANAVLPKTFQEPVSGSPERGIAIYSKSAPMRARLNSTARSLFLIPCDVWAHCKSETARFTLSGLALIENKAGEEPSRASWAGFSRTIWIHPNGLARCLSRTGTLLNEGLFSEGFLADCLE